MFCAIAAHFMNCIKHLSCFKQGLVVSLPAAFFSVNKGSCFSLCALVLPGHSTDTLTILAKTTSIFVTCHRSVFPIFIYIRGMFEMNCLFLSGDFKFQVSPKVLISCPRLIVLGFKDTSTLVGHFVSSPREREKSDRRDSRRD